MLDTLAFMTGNPTWILIILVLAILLFGANRIPEMMRNMGSGMKEFKKGLQEEEPKEETAKKE